DILHASTPKAGLIGVVAGRVMSVSVVVYHMRGLPYLTEHGVKKAVLRASERIACALAHVVVCVSESLRQQVIRDGVAPASKTIVLGAGSGNGVDVRGRFNPDTVPAHARAQFRSNLGIPQ